jgi:hypothetical protein
MADGRAARQGRDHLLHLNERRQQRPYGAITQRRRNHGGQGFARRSRRVACRRLPARDHRREVARALGGILSEDVGTDHALLDLATNDVVNQTVRAQHLLFTARGVQRYPVLSRFAYRSELDLMARPSGMPLPAIRRMGPRPVHSGESGSHLRIRTLAKSPRPHRPESLQNE